MTRMRLRAGACGEGKRTSLSLLATSGNRMTERVKRDGIDRKSKKRPVGSGLLTMSYSKFALGRVIQPRGYAVSICQSHVRYMKGQGGGSSFLSGATQAGCRVEFAFDERRVDLNQTYAHCAPQRSARLGSPHADPCKERERERERERESTTRILRELGL
jgi:hypothetical protein